MQNMGKGIWIKEMLRGMAAVPRFVDVDRVIAKLTPPNTALQVEQHDRDRDHAKRSQQRFGLKQPRLKILIRHFEEEFASECKILQVAVRLRFSSAISASSLRPQR